jgi:hypothetical protein
MNPETHAPSFSRATAVGLAAIVVFLLLSVAAGFVEKSGGFDHLREFLFMRFISFTVVLAWVASFCLILDSPLRRYRSARGVMLLVFLAALIAGAFGLAHLVILTASH